MLFSRFYPFCNTDSFFKMFNINLIYMRKRSQIKDATDGLRFINARGRTLFDSASVLRVECTRAGDIKCLGYSLSLNFLQRNKTTNCKRGKCDVYQPS